MIGKIAVEIGPAPVAGRIEPHDGAAALSVLGVAEDREVVARAVATWNAADLEEAIIGLRYGPGSLSFSGRPAGLA
jgi:hypothetical protein